MSNYKKKVTRPHASLKIKKLFKFFFL
jgi:hypothetical protein